MRRLVDPVRYGLEGQPHDLWAELRLSPPTWCSVENYPPFWAVTRHADVRAVSVAPHLFSSRTEVVATPLDPPRGPIAPSILGTDPPEHRDYRNLTLPYFKPRALRPLAARIREITRALLDTAPPSLDFVSDFAAWHPLRMLCELLGVPDEDIVLEMTNGLIGSADPEFAGSRRFGPYLRSLIADRRAQPRDDLSSLIANSPLSDRAAVTYLMIIAVAGHDTTRSALAGGMLALISNPSQLELLKSRPDLYESAANEIVRFTSPVVHFLRQAVEDCTLGGQQIRAGDRLMLFYPSANRDSAVFSDPFAFRVDRDPNPHLGWGVGEHYCLGANLARLEILILLEELIPRLSSVSLTGPPEWMASNVVCGVKHLPISWQLAPVR
jgi:cytochrome P450